MAEGLLGGAKVDFCVSFTISDYWFLVGLLIMSFALCVTMYIAKDLHSIMLSIAFVLYSLTIGLLYNIYQTQYETINPFKSLVLLVLIFSFTSLQLVSLDSAQARLDKEKKDSKHLQYLRNVSLLGNTVLVYVIFRTTTSGWFDFMYSLIECLLNFLHNLIGV